MVRTKKVLRWDFWIGVCAWIVCNKRAWVGSKCKWARLKWMMMWFCVRRSKRKRYRNGPRLELLRATLAAGGVRAFGAHGARRRALPADARPGRPSRPTPRTSQRRESKILFYLLQNTILSNNSWYNWSKMLLWLIYYKIKSFVENYTTGWDVLKTMQFFSMIIEMQVEENINIYLFVLYWRFCVKLTVLLLLISHERMLALRIQTNRSVHLGYFHLFFIQKKVLRRNFLFHSHALDSLLIWPLSFLLPRS